MIMYTSSNRVILINKIFILLVTSSYLINSSEINNFSDLVNLNDNDDSPITTTHVYSTTTKKSSGVNKKHRKNHRIAHRNSNNKKVKLNKETIANIVEINNNHNYRNITVKVGESVVLNCAIDSSYGLNPGVIWMQGKLGNVLTLNTNRITVDPRFEIIQQPLQDMDPNLITIKRDSSNLNEKQNEMSYYHLKISNVQIYDENEYACETSLTKKNDDQPNLHSLVYLHVTQSPSFIENLTSESNIPSIEFGDAILKCFALGKPSPKVKWYRIMEGNLLEDLQHESNTLTLRNISRHDTSKYECVASNGILPSVSKKFTVTVYFAPILSSIKPTIHHQLGFQTVVIGCTIVSNPDSSITWHKLNSNESSTDSYEMIIDSTANNKYQIHKFKQSNQTVSYLKIKNVDQTDYTKYKCQAANIVGKNEIIIEAKHIFKKHKNLKQKQNKQIIVHNHIDSTKSKSDDYFDLAGANDDEEENYLAKFDSSDTSDLDENGDHSKMSKNRLNKKKKLNMDHISNQLNQNNNKTLLKYRINNSNNKLIERENSLEKIQDSVIINQSAKLNKSKFDLLLLGLSVILFTYL